VAELEGNALLADLTAAQREAVMHMDGPLLILAGPGSGKTRVITRRVAYLLQQGVRPQNILAITFTNKAAREMRQRIEVLVPGTRLWISTFHSFGVRILREHGHRVNIERNFTIYDQSDRARLVKQAMEDAQVHDGKISPEAISGAISKAKNQLLPPDRYAQTAHDFFQVTVARVYPAYQKRLHDSNALDFDDLLYLPAMAFKHDRELRAHLDAQYRYVLIDEYQDTNSAQYAIARGLSIDYPNLCVVGDPDQSIYGFRGSDIRNILDFERDFPDARVLTLSQNYRSTKAILSAADHVIVHNSKRKHKSLVTENAQGEPVRVLTFETGLDEAYGIARRIRQAVESGGRKYRDFALFLRLNALSRALEQAFVRERVPFQIVRGLAFFDRKENRDVLAYLRLLVNPRDDLSILRIINEPARGLGKVTLENLRMYAEPREMSLLSAAASADKIEGLRTKGKVLQEFAAMMDELSKLSESPPGEVIRLVLDRTGYRQMLADSRDTEDQQRLANIEELITAANQFAAEDESRTLADFLENITLVSDVDSWDDQQDCVSIMTFHAAKGLEFPVVYMIALEQGILPHERSLRQPGEYEEERRLTFVGMTRAKEELYLCHTRQREFRGSLLYARPSEFLDELPAEGVERTDVSHTGSGRPPSYAEAGGELESNGGEYRWQPPPRPRDEQRLVQSFVQGTAAGNAVDFSKGMRVRHEKYGQGHIVEVGGTGPFRKVKVRFGSEERTFLVDKARLEIVGT
jgi:DNA helicase-2/ATP-dependent DNA helicase PcrA